MRELDRALEAHDLRRELDNTDYIEEDEDEYYREECEIDEEFDEDSLERMMADDEAHWITMWWESMTEDEQDEAIKRSFYAMNDDERIEAGKELAKLDTEEYKRAMRRSA